MSLPEQKLSQFDEWSQASSMFHFLSNLSRKSRSWPFQYEKGKPSKLVVNLKPSSPKLVARGRTSLAP